MNKTPVLSLMFLAILPLFAFQGCKEAVDAANAVSAAEGSGATGPVPVTSDTETSQLLAEVSYKYVDLQANSQREYREAILASNGCAVGMDYSQALARGDLLQSVPYYCNYLSSQSNTIDIAQDCRRAETLAAMIQENVRLLERNCVVGGYNDQYGNGYGDSRDNRDNRDQNGRNGRDPRRPDNHSNNNASLVRKIVEDSASYLRALGFQTPQKQGHMHRPPRAPGH